MDITEKFDFIKHFKCKDIPDNCMEFQIGEPVCILRNLNTQQGIVKNKRCWVKNVMTYSVVVMFEDGSTYTIPRIKFSGQTNGIHFTRMQIPLRPLFAGTVHKSQGMTLEKGIIDLRSNLWEHGQLYVALSRFKDPTKICILLPKNTDESDDTNEDLQIIKPVAEEDIVKMVLQIEEMCKNGCIFTDGTDDNDTEIDQIIPHDQNQLDDDINSNSNQFDDDSKEEEPLPAYLIQKGYIEEDFSQHGLKNLGNTCALNSILQILSHISPFYQRIMKAYYKSDDMDSNIITIWRNFLLDMNRYIYSKDSQIIAPLEICQILNIDINKEEQMDVQEIFLSILRQISNYEQSINEILFESEYINPDNVLEQAFCFIILTNNLDINVTHSLYALIELQFPIRKFIKLPLILTFYINRVQFVNENTSTKNLVKIFIEDEIEISTEDKVEKYDLFGIIIHIGNSPNRGHYTAFIKMNEQWFYYNDSQVYKVTPDLVQHYSFDSTHKNATMVFYIQHESISQISLHDIANLCFDKEERKKQFVEKVTFFVNMGFPPSQVENAIKIVDDGDNVKILKILYEGKIENH